MSLFHADDIFGTINTEDFQDPEDTTMQLPSYEMFDFGASYTLNNLVGNNLYLRLNINNLFNEEYYYMSRNNVIATPTTPTYKGIPLNAIGFSQVGEEHIILDLLIDSKLYFLTNKKPFKMKGFLFLSL